MFKAHNSTKDGWSAYLPRISAQTDAYPTSIKLRRKESETSVCGGAKNWIGGGGGGKGEGKRERGKGEGETKYDTPHG